MRRTLRIGAGFLLALLIVTCTDKDVTGPRARGVAALNLSAFQSAPVAGQPDIPLDSLRITLVRIADGTSALDTVLHTQADTLPGDSLVLHLSVQLKVSPEDFQLTVLAYGGGAVWYQATDTTSITAGATASPRLLARYVGPGARATSVTIGPVDTTVVGGQPVALRYTVDSASVPIANVPVGFRVSDTTKGKVTQPSFTTGTFVGASAIRDSVWLYVETPTHLRDSTRIHIVPPPSKLVKVAGDSQAAIVNTPLAQQLAVRVEDALNGGDPGTTVTWSVTAGTATVVPLTVVSDTGGYARVTVTPTSLGTVKVQAAVGGLTGSPIAFTVNVLAGTVRQVIISPKLDTIAKGATAQFTAVLKDSLGNVISSIKPTWSSSNGAVATVDTTGLATALAGDSTRIVASAGGFADTARLFVRAIAKVAITPSDTVITAVGDSVHLAGVVLTNFGDTIKTGTVIRFASTTPSVVTVNAVTGEALLVGPGNGVVVATDTVSKVIGTATLRVNQKVNGIVNIPPDSVEVGVGGQAQIVATAVDRNNHPIPGKTFGWLSRTPSTATVNQSGVVTGVAVGLKTFVVDTLVDSVSVFKDSTLVSVVLAPPPVLQWAFDTLAIGNGGNTTVTLSLNVASVAGTVLQISSSDSTRVKPTQNRIVIGTGGASASVTLQGLSATVAPVNVVAHDSAGIYKDDTLRVVVVSTIYFAPVGQTTRTQDYYLNQNETLNAQVFLSDPAPLGGLGVTFVFGKPGTSAVVPTTVIIPQGQLAAPIQFAGVATGTDSVIPTSGAFAGKFSYLHVAANNLAAVQPYPYFGTIGLGQYEQVGVQFTYGMDHPLPFTATVTPGSIATVPSPDTVLTGNNSRYFYVNGTALGAGTLTLSATNWVSASVPVIVTTPKLQANTPTTIIAGAPPSSTYWYAYAEDSLTYQHPVTAPVHVTALSRDTTVVKVLVDTLTIPLNSSSGNVGTALQAQPGAGGDSTYLVITAPGYRTDSALIHVTPPAMGVSYNYPYDGRVGLNTQFPNAAYVTIPYARTDSFWVLLSHTRKGIVAGADSMLIPKGQTTGYTTITGDTLGTDTVTITRATGYTLPAAPQFVFHVDSLHIRPYSYPTTLYTISTPQVINVAVLDPQDNIYRPLINPMPVTLALSRPGVITLDSLTVTIAAGQAFSAYDTIRVAGSVNAPDSTRILSTAAGSTPDSSSVIHVQPSPLNFNMSGGNFIGRGLRTQNNYVYLPAAAPNTLSVALTRLVPGKDSTVPTFLTIPKGSSSSSYFDVWAFDSTGTDTLVATATGFVTTRVTLNLLRDTLIISKPSLNQITTAPPYRLYTYLYNKSIQNQRPWAPVTLTFTSTNPNVVSIDSGQTVNGTLDTVSALADTNRAYAVVRINFAGPGTAYLKVSAPGFGPDSMGPFNVTGPSLTVSSPSTTVGTGQYVIEQVYVQNPVASPLTITLQRSDSTLPPASQAFVFSPTTLTIPAGQTSSNVDTIYGNTIGTAQLLVRAPGYGGASATVQVGQPRLSAPTNLNIYVGAVPSFATVFTWDQNSNYRNVSAPTTVSTTITDPTVVAVDSAQRVVALHQGSTSAFQFTALKKGAVQVYFSAPTYKPDTMVVVTDTGTLSVSTSSILGVNEVYQNSSVSLPYATQNPVVVTLTSSNPSVLKVPATVTILANNSSVSFTDTGVALGSATITASAPGVARQSTAVGVTVGTPRLFVSITTTANAGQLYGFNVYSQDSAGNYHPVSSNLTVSLTSSSPTHTVFNPASPTILAGNQNVSSQVTFDTAGTYTVTASAPGFTSGQSAVVTVTGAMIRVGVGNGLTFTPGTDTLSVGTYGTWVWDATNLNNHGVHWLTAPGALPGDSPTQSTGTYNVYFSTPGTYTYQCSVHGPVMSGTIVVQ